MLGRAVGAAVVRVLDAMGGFVAPPAGVSVVAHRGYAATSPENTVAAVEATAGVADAVEIDVRRCASGEIVVCHDPTVDRVTDGRGSVSTLDAATLDGLSVHGSDDGVPTLDALLGAVPDDVAVNIELKERGLGDDVAAAAARVENDVWVSSFDPVALRDVDLPTALLFYDRPRENLALAEELDCDAVHPDVSLCIGTRVVSRAKDRGFSVNAWTVDSPGVAWALAARGVDGVIADRASVVQRQR